MSILSLSPLAQDLFSHAICESGTILVPCVVMSQSFVSKQLESKLANIPGMSTAVTDYVRYQQLIILNYKLLRPT